MLRLCVAGISLALVVPSAHAERYSLAALVQKVALNHPSVAAAAADKGTYKNRKWEQELRWLPFGDAVFSLGGQPKVRCLGDDADPTAVIVNCQRTDNVDFLRGTGDFVDRTFLGGVNFRVDMGIIQPIFTSGKLEVAVPVFARALNAAGRAYYARDREDVIRSTTELYWQLKASRVASKLYQDNVVETKKWVERIENALADKKNRMFNPGDLIRMRIGLANAETGALNQLRTYNAALAELRILVGDEEADIDDDEVSLAPSLETEDGLVAYEKALDDAAIRRVESTLIDLLVEEGRGWYRLRLAELLPDLGLKMGFSFGKAPNVDRPSRAGLAYFPEPLGVGFGIGLREGLDFGQKAARLRAAAADLRSRRAKREMYRGHIAIDATQAFAAVKEARARAIECARAEKHARGLMFTLDTVRTVGFGGDGREVLDAMQQWNDFRARGIWAIADANKALAWLQRASGRLAIPDDKNPTEAVQ